MTDRERWIIYPLLFLALGVALRDKFTRSVHADFITCNKTLRCQAIVVEGVVRSRALVIRGEDDQELVLIKGQRTTAEDQPQEVGAIHLFASDRQPIGQWSKTLRCQRAAVAEAVRTKVVVADEALKTGALVVVNADEKPLVALGEETYLQGDTGQAGGAVKIYDVAGRSLARVGPVVECREIRVVDPGEGVRVRLGTTRVGGERGASQTVGRVSVHGHDGQLRVGLGTDPTGTRGVVSTHGGDREPLIALGSRRDGGLLTIFDRYRRLTLALGHFDRASGVVAEKADGRLVKWLPLVPLPPPPPEVPGPPEPPIDEPPEEGGADRESALSPPAG